MSDRGEYNPTDPRETRPGTQADYPRTSSSDVGNGGSSTPEISADIERTRRQMGQRIDQIQAKLDPDRLINEAQVAVRDVLSDTASSITEYMRENRDNITSSITRAARRNPLPTALVGLGVGWLLLESLSGDSGSSRRKQSWERSRRSDREYINRRQLAYGEIYSDPYSDAYDETEYDFETTGPSAYATRSSQGFYRDAQGNVYDRAEGRYRERSTYRESGSGPMSKAKDTLSHVAETVKDQVGGVVETVKDKVEDMTENVQHQAGQMGQRAEDQWASTGYRAQERAQEMTGRMRRMTRRRGRQFQSSLEDNPLTYGALALAAGALLAYMLPQTEMENQAVGRYRDQLVDEADELVHEATQRAKEVVDEVRPELERSAKEIGRELEQTAKQAGERIKDEVNPVVEKAKEAAKDEARQAAAERGMTQKPQATSSQSLSTAGQGQPLSTADRNKLQGRWHELRGSVKQKWGKISDDELSQIEGSYEKLTGMLQRHYGYSQSQAQHEIDEYLRQRM